MAKQCLLTLDSLNKIYEPVFLFWSSYSVVVKVLSRDLHAACLFSAPRYFTVERLRHVAKQCLLTLDCLHKRGVIHCDMKPENILISSLTACKIKVIDYGEEDEKQTNICVLNGLTPLKKKKKAYQEASV